MGLKNMKISFNSLNQLVNFFKKGINIFEKKKKKMDLRVNHYEQLWLLYFNYFVFD